MATQEKVLSPKRLANIKKVAIGQFRPICSPHQPDKPTGYIAKCLFIGEGDDTPQPYPLATAFGEHTLRLLMPPSSRYRSNTRL